MFWYIIQLLIFNQKCDSKVVAFHIISQLVHSFFFTLLSLYVVIALEKKAKKADTENEVKNNKKDKE